MGGPYTRHFCLGQSVSTGPGGSSLNISPEGPPLGLRGCETASVRRLSIEMRGPYNFEAQYVCSPESFLQDEIHCFSL